MGDEKGSHLCGWFTISFPLQGMEKLHKPEAEITLRKNNSWLKLYRKLYMYKIDTWIAYTPTVQVLENFLKFNRWMLLEWNAASRELTTEGLMAEKGPILTSGIIFYLSIGAAIFQILEEPNWKTAVSDYGIKRYDYSMTFPRNSVLSFVFSISYYNVRNTHCCIIHVVCYVAQIIIWLASGYISVWIVLLSSSTLYFR